MNIGWSCRNPNIELLLSLRRQRVLPPEAIRALPRGRALILATGAKAAMVRLLPWYAGPDSAAIADALGVEEESIRRRAAAALEEEQR